MANTIERTIHFFKVVPRTNRQGASYAVDVPAALRAVSALPFDPGGRYLDEGNGARLCLWPEAGQSPTRARLARVRGGDWPEFEDKGELQALSAPTRTAGLAESIHFAAFADGIVGVEFNFRGPRPSRISHYLMEKAAAQSGRFDLAPLLRLDVTEQLDRLADVRAFSIKTPVSYASVLRKFGDDLPNAIEGLAAYGKADVVDVILRPQGRKKALSHKLLTLAKRVAGLPDSRTEMDRFVIRGVSGQTGRIEEVDVLSDLLVSKKSVLRQDTRTKAVASESAFTAIKEAYAELERDLRDAAGLRSDI